MLKQLPLVGLLYLISACQPVSEQDTVIAQTLPAHCIASQSQCEIKTEYANFTVKFSQHQLSDNVKTELPFFIELAESSQSEQVSQKSKINISAYIEGRDMFMGKVPMFFKETAKNNVYVAESLLANCSAEQMIWRLWITIDTADLKGQAQTFFVDFTSQRL